MHSGLKVNRKQEVDEPSDYGCVRLHFIPCSALLLTRAHKGSVVAHYIGNILNIGNALPFQTQPVFLLDRHSAWPSETTTVVAFPPAIIVVIVGSWSVGGLVVVANAGVVVGGVWTVVGAERAPHQEGREKQ